MSHKRQVVDGLWRCLCPAASADSAPLAPLVFRAGGIRRMSHFVAPPPHTRPTPWANPEPGASPAVATNTQTLSTMPRLNSQPAAVPIEDDHDVPAAPPPPPAPEPGSQPIGVFEALASTPDPPPETLPLKFPPVTVGQLVTARPPYTVLYDAQLKTIYEAFQQMRGHAVHTQRITEFLGYIINHRTTKLRFYHFNLLTEAMADPRGSAKTVRQLLHEMKLLDIKPKPLMYHNVLAALAVHPDYVLRNAVLKEMRSRWISKSVLDECFEALGLLRDTQYEMALDKIESLIKDGILLPPWVLEIFTVVFSNLGHLDEAFQLMFYRFNPTFRNPPPEYNLHMLETFSQGYHYKGTKFMWKRITQTNRLHPSDAVVQHVIHTGARYGDPTLILQALDLMAARGTKIGTVQFEPLVDCYALIGDMPHAVRVLSLMNRTQAKPRRPSTRGLFAALRKNPALVGEYETALRSTPNVPIGAVNVLLEALHAQANAARLLQTYQAISSLTDEPATSETFGYLVDAVSDTATLVFLADEASMVVPELRVRTTLLHKLANACVAAGKLDLAVKYFGRVNDEWRSGLAKEQKRPMKEAYRVTFQGVFRALLEKRDVRAVRVWLLGKTRMPQLGGGLRRELDATWPEVWDEWEADKKRRGVLVQGEGEGEMEGKKEEELNTLHHELEHRASEERADMTRDEDDEGKPKQQTVIY